VGKDPLYLSSLGFGHVKVEMGQGWDFPILEIFTQMEAVDRAISLPEALALSGISANQLQEILLKTAWISALLKHLCGRRGFDLVEGKLAPW
jgi:phosphoribosylaminoimidazole-succinocarboxamide synthase